VVTFSATIEESARGGAVVRVPDDVVTQLGGGGRIKVRATFDGVAYRGSVVTMGGAKLIGVLRSIQNEIGKRPGDTITVTLERDDAPRVVEIPDDLRAALEAADALDRFAAASHPTQRELVRSVEGAKRPDMRARRIQQAVERIRGSA